MANYLDSQYTQLFFSLSIQHKDFVHLLPLFDTIVFSFKRSPFLHKNVMLLAWNSTSSTSIVIVYDHLKTIVETINPSKYNPSILVICILKVNHQI